MRISELKVHTQKEIPKDLATKGARNLARGGFIHKTMAGAYSFLPLGFRVLKKIEQIIREELEKINVAEVLLPVLQPAKLWQKSGRYNSIDQELWRVKGRTGEDFVLSMTAEEVITDAVKSQLSSYKDLPIFWNQFQTKIRDEARPRGGLLRLREFSMQDAYSFDTDEKTADQSFDNARKAYKNIFEKCGLKALEVQADVGAMGGSASKEYMVESEAGEDTIVFCDKCNYAANAELAECLLPIDEKRQECREEKEKVKTPDLITVEEVSEFLKVNTKEVLKTMIYKIKDKLIMVVIRGDFHINNKKLVGIFGEDIVSATDEDMEKADLVPGFVSPVGKNIEVYGDHSLKFTSCSIAGANERDYHYKNISLKDLHVMKWVDVMEVKEGMLCRKCGGVLKTSKGIEVGHVFLLGDKYSKTLGAYFVDKDGSQKPAVMGCYGIGLDRMMGTIAEVNSDEKGLIWPASVAPYQVYLIDIGGTEETKNKADEVYEQMIKTGVEVLYDDREESAGVKFADADLLGIPVRVTISKRTLEKDSVEIKKRDSEEYELVKFEEMVEKLKVFC